jgi:hypothetical protein
MHAIKTATESLSANQISAVHTIALAISDYQLLAKCQRALEGQATYTDREEIYAAYTHLARALAEVR